MVGFRLRNDFLFCTEFGYPTRGDRLALKFPILGEFQPEEGQTSVPYICTFLFSVNTSFVRGRLPFGSHKCDDETIIVLNGVPIGFRCPFQSGTSASNQLVLACFSLGACATGDTGGVSSLSSPPVLFVLLALVCQFGMSYCRIGVIHEWHVDRLLMSTVPILCILVQGRNCLELRASVFCLIFA